MSEPPNHTGKPAQKPEEAPGVPGFHSWRGVYVFVLISFVVVVGLLAWFKYAFNE